MSLPLQLVHYAVTAYMVGIIWFVQLVHYPMLHLTDGEDAPAGHREYTSRMGIVVMPVMLAELALQALWILKSPTLYVIISGVLLLVVWGSTFFLQVPCHTKLTSGYDQTVHRKLVRTNWIRTISWTARAIMIGVALNWQMG